MADRPIYALMDIELLDVLDEFDGLRAAVRAYERLVAEEPERRQGLGVVEFADYEDPIGRLVLGGPDAGAGELAAEAA
jgi:hypothetical protein